MARSTASRSSSVPCVMSTTSRMPARIAAGRRPFHVWSRTSTIAVPGRLAAHELGEAERIGLLDLGRQHEHVDRVERVDQELLCRRRGLHPAHLVRLDLERSRQLLTEGLRRPDGDDARIGHGAFTSGSQPVDLIGCWSCGATQGRSSAVDVRSATAVTSELERSAPPRRIGVGDVPRPVRARGAVVWSALRRKRSTGRSSCMDSHLVRRVRWVRRPLAPSGSRPGRASDRRGRSEAWCLGAAKRRRRPSGTCRAPTSRGRSRLR